MLPVNGRKRTLYPCCETVCDAFNRQVQHPLLGGVLSRVSVMVHAVLASKIAYAYQFRARQNSYNLLMRLPSGAQPSAAAAGAESSEPALVFHAFELAQHELVIFLAPSREALPAWLHPAKPADESQLLIDRFFKPAARDRAA